MSEFAYAPRSNYRWSVLILLLAVTASVAAIGSLATLPQIPTWYANLEKPSFTPPSWLFGPVWSILYIAMAFAAWRISGAPVSWRNRRQALGLFALQLALNAAWSPIFFGREQPALGLAVIVAMLVAIAVTVVAFWRIDRWSGALMMPYLAWVAFATVLNASIVALNP
jgi:benzodiazapine receptor